MPRLRYPLLIFLTLAVLVVGYAVFAGATTRRTVDNLVDEQAQRIAEVVRDFAVNAFKLSPTADADRLVLDLLAALAEDPDARRTALGVVSKYLTRLRLDRLLVVDAAGNVLVDAGRPRRPGAADPERFAGLARREEQRLLDAARRIAAGELDAEEVAAQAGPGNRAFRRVADRYCLILLRSAEAVRQLELDVGGHVIRQFENHPTVAYVRLLDAGGREIAQARGRSGEGARHWEGEIEIAGRPHRLEVGIHVDRQTRAVARRARSLPILLGLVVLGAGGIAIALVFRLQHAYLERERELRRRAEQDRRLASLGRLTAGVAHEIKNPLNAIRLSAGRLERRLLEGEQPILDAITASIHSITQTVEDFMKLARDPAPSFAEEDPGLIFAEAVAQVRPMAEELGRVLDADAPAAAGPVRLDAARLREALVNLLRNALQAARTRVAARVRRDGAGLAFEIDDDGPGVPRAQRAEIFEFFYTTKPDGTGLGLPLAHRVAEEHGGSLRVGDAPLGGARFTLTLPA